MTRAVCILALFLAPTLAWAGDAEAEAKLKEAFKHWNDERPNTCMRLLNEALAAKPDSDAIYNRILLMKGSLHNIKTGDLEEAKKLYSEVIRNLAGIGDEDRALRAIKADAMYRKGTLVYADEDDVKGALQLYISSYKTFPKPTVADVASQLCVRRSYSPALGNMEKGQLMETALEMSTWAIENVQFDYPEEPKQSQYRAKFTLQKALVVQAMGDEEGAKELYATINQDDLNVPMSLYQKAIMLIQWGQIDEGTALLKEWLGTRKTITTRNQARKFIRNEPVLAEHLERDDWGELTRDERERTGVRVTPRSRPSDD